MSDPLTPGTVHLNTESLPPLHFVIWLDGFLDSRSTPLSTNEVNAIKARLSLVDRRAPLPVPPPLFEPRVFFSSGPGTANGTVPPEAGFE